MKSNIRFITAFCSLSCFCSFAQIDDSLNSIGLTDFKHFAAVNSETGEVEYEKMKDRKSAKVLLFKQLYLEKHNDAWLYDADSCSLKRIKATKMAYFSEGTKAIYCGLSYDVGVIERKTFRAVSFPVLEEMNVGDTLRFSLTLLADKGHTFQPIIYTSAKLKTKQGQLRNGDYLSLWGKVPKGSGSDHDVVQTTVSIPITEANKEIGWIHLVNDEEQMHRGFIIQKTFEIGGTQSEAFRKVYFSSESANVNEEGRALLDKIVGELDSTSVINLRGYADPYGDKAYNMRLAEKRAKSVKDYLIEKGVDPKQITIEEFDILYSTKSKEGRICTILVL